MGDLKRERAMSGSSLQAAEGKERGRIEQTPGGTPRREGRRALPLPTRTPRGRAQYLLLLLLPELVVMARPSPVGGNLT